MKKTIFYSLIFASLALLMLMPLQSASITETPTSWEDNFTDELGISLKENITQLNGDINLKKPLWWNETWNYVMSINISNTAGDLTDYQINITVDTAALISAGKMKPDCSDIRFIDSDGATEIPYWIESGCNTASTKIWSKVASIPASSIKTIYLYYGNPSGEIKSNKSAALQYKTYDFTDILNNKAYSGKTAAAAVPVPVDRTTWDVPGTEFIAGDYTAISSPNNVRTSISADAGLTQQVVHDFVFKIDESPGSIHSMNISWEGYASKADESVNENDLRLYLLDKTTSLFELKESELDNSCPGPADCTIGIALNSNAEVDEYLDGAGNVRVIVQKHEASLLGLTSISTCEELQKIGNDAAYPLDDDYYLENDIDCSATNPYDADNIGSPWDY
ncbi:MAG: DUF2341 domain-containing protein, partial [Candidatus Aenigmarchaeota archaeon]|nr:DUF2341 domain-containing protein [Candidatus Aenigmarchaeota archaeon]